MTDEDANIELALEQARQRYQIERDKRLRDDGNRQYNELKGDFAEFDADPYVEPGFTREAIVEETDAVIIGAGFAGMLTAISLTEHGIRDFRIVEKAGDFGGTWYWNRYPGCMCDVESYSYMPLLEETGYMPTEKYASAPEIFAYCQLLGRHYDLYQHALFQTQIQSADWNEDTKRWHIVTSRGDQLSARFMVIAGGILHKAKLPGIPGIETFAGKAFHTSRWDYDYTGGGPRSPMDKLADKRVGIIGTGATAVQAVPQLARAAKEVYVFQRTPSAVGVRNNGPTDVEWYQSLKPGWQAERVRNFTQSVTGTKPDVDMVKDGWTEVMWENTQAGADTPEGQRELEISDFKTMEKLRQRVDDIIEDHETAEKLKPWYGKHCKRVCFHDDYLPAFNQPNVHLVDTDGKGVQEITPAGPVVAGQEYPLDMLVFASGFEVTTDLDQRLGFDPRGRGGTPLSERWFDGAHTLHGVMSADFPNMLLLGTVQAGFGTNFVHFLGQSAKHLGWLMATCIEDGVATIEPTPEAEEEWLMVLYGALGGLAEYSGGCTPSYYNGEQGGNPKSARNLPYAGSMLDYGGYLDRWREEGSFSGTTVTRVGES